MTKAYKWIISVNIVQNRGHGEDMPPEDVFSSIYTVESDHALSIAEGLERCVRQERWQEEGP